MATAESGEQSYKSCWWYHQVKCTVCLGTCHNWAFHASLDRPSADKINVPLFSEFLPFYKLPMIGVYGLNDYYLTEPLVLLVLPTDKMYNLFDTFLPQDLTMCLNEHIMQRGIGNFCKIYTMHVLVTPITKMLPEHHGLLDFCIKVHSHPNFEFSVDNDQKIINILYHTWALQDNNVESETTVLAGLFNTEGVSETAQDIAEELNGIPIGRLGPRIQYMHDGQSLSPHNCQLLLQNDQFFHNFYSLAKHPDNKVILSYHIVPGSQAVENKLMQAIKLSNHLGDLLESISVNVPQLSSCIKKIKLILYHCL